jgi:hypothetical protein
MMAVDDCRLWIMMAASNHSQSLSFHSRSIIHGHHSFTVEQSFSHDSFTSSGEQWFTGIILSQPISHSWSSFFDSPASWFFHVIGRAIIHRHHSSNHSQSSLFHSSNHSQSSPVRRTVKEWWLQMIARLWEWWLRMIARLDDLKSWWMLDWLCE